MPIILGPKAILWHFVSQKEYCVSVFFSLWKDMLFSWVLFHCKGKGNEKIIHEQSWKCKWEILPWLMLYTPETPLLLGGKIFLMKIKDWCKWCRYFLWSSFKHLFVIITYLVLFFTTGWAWWYRAIILVTQEIEGGGSQCQALPGLENRFRVNPRQLSDGQL